MTATSPFDPSKSSLGAPNPLASYWLSYEVTALPVILFAELVRADTPLSFSEFYVPKDVLGAPVECRVLLYNNRGHLIEMSSSMTVGYPSAIAAVLNVAPLKMINNLLNTLLK